MPELQKAVLAQLTGTNSTKTVPGTEVTVQFNPTTMRLQMTNSVEGGKSRPRQVQQYTASGSTTLTLDLVFDTADQLTNVRDKTVKLAKFVEPSSQSQQAPPRIRFLWGTFQFDGVMNSITEDIDLFSPAGIPLRSKVSISIKEQKFEFEALAKGPGAKQGSAATAPGDAATVSAPGGSGGGPTDRTAPAQAGESAADFAVRMGLDPAAWRGVAGGIANPLSLTGGLQIDFNSNLSVSAGVGVSAQLQAGASLDITAAAGLQLSGGAGAEASTQAGFALSAAGGVSAATQAVDVVRTETAAAQARAAFDVPAPAAGAAPGAARPRTLGAGSVPAATASVVAARATTSIDPVSAAPGPVRTPLQRSASQLILPDSGSPAPAPPRSDPRAVSFGFGIPLRPRISGAAEDRPGAEGWVRLGARPRTPTAPESVDPTAAPWLALPSVAGDRAAADAKQGTVAADRACACGGCGSPTSSCACGGMK
jgi:hypothetical protein